MIRELATGTKQFFLDKFKKSKYLDDVKKFKDDNLVLFLATEDEFYRFKQRTTFHMILKALWDSGETSFKSYNELRNDFKERNGFVLKEKKEEPAIIRNIQRVTYSNLPTQEIKDLYAKSINESKVTYRSLSEATKDEYIMLIKDALALVDEIGVSSKQLDEARHMWDSIK